MIKRWFLKILIFFSLIGMINDFMEEECLLALICASCIIVYMVYRLVKLIIDFDAWGDVTSRYYIQNSFNLGYDNYEYLNSDKHIVVNGSGTSKTYTYNNFNLTENEIKELSSNFKKREDKIEILETIVKEVDRPIIKEKKETKKIVKKTNKKEENVTINPSEFNQDLIMLVNSTKLSKDVSTLYDCIIKALKDLKYPSSAIANILSAFPYVDFVGNQAIIYINNRQFDGNISKIKRHIITNINEKFNNEVKTSFEDMKYMSVLDYFAKTNAL